MCGILTKRCPSLAWAVGASLVCEQTFLTVALGPDSPGAQSLEQQPVGGGIGLWGWWRDIADAGRPGAFPLPAPAAWAAQEPGLCSGCAQPGLSLGCSRAWEAKWWQEQPTLGSACQRPVVASAAVASACTNELQ